MLIRHSLLVIVTACLLGWAVAFFWVQAELPTTNPISPWGTTIGFFPSIYAVWLPLVYLFFSGIWLYLFGRDPEEDLWRALRLDGLTYLAAGVFMLLQFTWKDIGTPALWFRVFLWLLILSKGLFVLRVLYQSPALLHPGLLIALGVGLHILIMPLSFPALNMTIMDVGQHATLMHLATLIVKSVGLNLLTLEMWRLALTMTRTPRSAFFSWIAVTCTFPVLGFPKITYILVGLLFIFVLRLVFSRLNTRELMMGLLTTTNVVILLKLLVVVFLLIAAGVIFWSNAKPGFTFRGDKALLALIATLFDGQFGLVNLAPIYWLAGFGLVYLVFFMVWDGMLLILTGCALYLGYHFAVYGVLERLLGQSGSVPFLGILGVFIAIAHARFGKMLGFRYIVRLAALLTIGLTSLLLLDAPEVAFLPAKMADIQRFVMLTLGRDLTALLPSSFFRPFSLSFFLWGGAVVFCALLFCNHRTRSAILLPKNRRHAFLASFHVREFAFAPNLVCSLLAVGLLLLYVTPGLRPVAFNAPLTLNRFSAQSDVPLAAPQSAQGVMLVSKVTGSTSIPQDVAVADVILFDADGNFETVTLHLGRDTADERLEHTKVKTTLAHGRAALYRSWMVTEGATSFLAHEYYTRVRFSPPLTVKKVTLKFLDPAPDQLTSTVSVQVAALFLLE